MAHAAQPGATDRPAGQPQTIRELRDSGYRPRTVKQELRRNLMGRLQRDDTLFPGIIGFEETVVPQIENAILSGQDIIFLGERGQAKTRMARTLVSLLDEWVPVHRRLRDQRRSTRPDLRPLPRRCVAEQGDDAADRLAAARPTLRREAGHAGHHHRRSDRRGRPDQGRRRPLPVGRADHPLRPAAAHPSRHLRHQRAARPRRAHPGRPAQHHGGARRPDPRLQDPPAARPVRDRLRQPRGLHQPRPHHHAAQGPLRLADPHPLPADASSTRWTSWSRSAASSDRRGIRHGRALVHARDRGRGHAPGAQELGHLAALGRQRARQRRQLREHAVERPQACDPTAGDGRSRRASPTCWPSVQSTGGKIELETLGDRDEEKVIDKLVQKADRERLQPPLRAARVRRAAGWFRERARRSRSATTCPAWSTCARRRRSAASRRPSRSSAGRATRPQIASAIEFVLEGLHLNRKLNKDRTSGRMRYRS